MPKKNPRRRKTGAVQESEIECSPMPLPRRPTCEATENPTSLFLLKGGLAKTPEFKGLVVAGGSQLGMVGIPDIPTCRPLSPPPASCRCYHPRLAT